MLTSCVYFLHIFYFFYPLILLLSQKKSHFFNFYPHFFLKFYLSQNYLMNGLIIFLSNRIYQKFNFYHIKLFNIFDEKK